MTFSSIAAKRKSDGHRSFPRANQKVTWALLIVNTGGIGWLIDLFQYGLKPRPSAPAENSLKESVDSVSQTIKLST